MVSHGFCWILLGVALVSWTESIQTGGYLRHVFYDANPAASRSDTRPPSTIQVGNITIQTGQNWSVNVFDFVKVKRRPGGGVDVDIKRPDFLSRVIPPNGSTAARGPNILQDIRRNVPKLIANTE